MKKFIKKFYETTRTFDFYGIFTIVDGQLYYHNYSTSYSKAKAKLAFITPASQGHPVQDFIKDLSFKILGTKYTFIKPVVDSPNIS